MFSLFLHTDELAVVSQGAIFKNPDVVLDTMRVHLAPMRRQVITAKTMKVYVINKNAAVVSGAFKTDFQFKTGKWIRDIPYALTILYIRTDDRWKIAHYHN